MIIFRQNNFSINYNQFFPRVDKNLELDIEGILPENTVKSVLRDWKNTILKNIWENDKDFATEHKLSEKDYMDSITLQEISYGVWEDDEIEFTFGAGKNTKLYNFYGSDYFWCLSFSGKTGKFITMYSGD